MPLCQKPVSNSTMLCVAANRECDPDVCLNCFVSCGDGTCGAPPPKETSYNCMNMKLFQNQHQKVLIGESCVSGWGAFLMNECEKDAFIGEYTGELITHYEANKRGKTYDRLNSSYLFDLDDQYVIDAYGMGSNLRFANHSPRPNWYVKNLLVAGDHRIGIFAKEKIYAGQELFIDYGYKADIAPSWAKDHKVSSSDEDYSRRSSRAKKRIGAKEKISDSDKDEDYTSRSTRAKKEPGLNGRSPIQIKMRTTLHLAAEPGGRHRILRQKAEPKGRPRD